MRIIVPAAAIIMLALSGCANRPIPVVQDVPTQYRMEAARHWQVLANQTANKLVKTLNELPPTGGKLPAEGVPPMYLALPDNPTLFDKSFRDLLTTELVDRNVPVASQKTPGVLTVTSNVQVIEYGGKPSLRTFPGAATALGSFGALEYGLFTAGGAGAGLGVALGALGIDAVMLHDDPDTEVIITTSLEANGGYLARKTSIYYIQSEDKPKYARQPPPKPRYPMRKVELSAR